MKNILFENQNQAVAFRDFMKATGHTFRPNQRADKLSGKAVVIRESTKYPGQLALANTKGESCLTPISGLGADDWDAILNP